MPLRTAVRVSFTPIRRGNIVVNIPRVLAAVQHDLNGRADAVISEMKSGYSTSTPRFYQRTNRLGAGWRKKQDGVGVRITNEVQGQNWSGDTVRYAQFVHGTVTDPDRQGQYQQDWPLIYDAVNKYFANAAVDRSHAYARFLQRLVDRHFS